MRKTERLTRLALLTSVALIIFIIELRIPNIIPVYGTYGIKLGLANIITVYAVYIFTPEETIMLVVSRVILGSVFGGNVSTLIYSLSGALMCLLGMLLIRKIIPLDYIWLCSMLGAVFHNIGQICAAIVMMRSFAVVAYLPMLFISGCIAGLFTGLCAYFVIKRLNKNDFQNL